METERKPQPEPRGRRPSEYLTPGRIVQYRLADTAEGEPRWRPALVVRCRGSREALLTVWTIAEDDHDAVEHEDFVVRSELGAPIMFQTEAVRGTGVTNWEWGHNVPREQRR